MHRMGICINYNGTLDDPTRLDEVLDKIRDFCKAAGWECHEASDHFSGVIGVPHEMMNHNPADGPRPDLKHIWDMTKRPPQLIEETVRGVLVVPPDTEWVRLKFDQRGRIVDYWEMTADQFIGGIAGETHYMALALFCKTAGPSFESSIDSHIGICALLKMLEPYMSNLHVV